MLCISAKDSNYIKISFQRDTWMLYHDIPYFVELILKVIKYFFKFHLLPKIFALTCIIKLYKEQDVQTATNYQNIADIY